MKVSVIIPVYNAEKTVRRCLDSIIQQTSSEWEVIAINDGSKDNSEKILREYEEKEHERIRVFTQNNSGVTKTRERGIREAKGQYIMFVDNDDYLEPDYIDVFLSEIEKGDYDVVVGGYRRGGGRKKKHFFL